MRNLLMALVLAGGTAQAADITASVTAPNQQRYNASWRDVGNNTNAPTCDVVTSNSYAVISSTSASVKTTGGYLEQIVINQPCLAVTYVIADAAAPRPNYATVISTWTSTETQGPTVIPMRVRFTNGLQINVTLSSCTVTASYR